jgi:phospholipase/carboxylesterase/glyoxalase family protein
MRFIRVGLRRVTSAAELSGFLHRFVPLPGPGTGPVLLLLHGTGGNENDLLPLGQAIARDAALLSPRGQVLEHGMPRFFRRTAEGVFDLDDLRVRTHELVGFIEAARERYGLAGRPIIAVGFSNGANIAASLLLRRGGLLRAAVLFRPMVPFVPKAPPDLTGTAVLISAGGNDTIAPPEGAERLAGILRGAGADVTLRMDGGEHSIGPAEVAAAREWVGRIA